MEKVKNCDVGEGRLPCCAPLALSAMPAQGRNGPRYDSGKSLARGTLFPELDLPLGNIVNSTVPDVPAAELMALDFAAHDLSLYLDTHPDDGEAFAVYKELLKLAETGRKRYTERFGPVTKTELRDAAHYNWLKDPWPWEYGKED
ncbi:MAG: spore coat protein CotJB [Oscillospiraceae bacterium]|nr:spore coat protein CotJB [Oscillospiraceae bacterium]